MNEFELIRQYFQRPASNALLGVGDDAALLLPTPGKALAVSSDMLVCDRHFFADTDPYWLGHKALAVNLSDMAAMGARPRWFLLSLALPAVDKDWLARFSAGLFSLADAHEVSLVGGDTTRGPLNLSLQIIGEVSPEQALRRDQALPGDDIWISGQVGEAALALRHLQQQVTLPAADVEALLPRLQAPQPRVSLGLALAPYSRCAIDVSDGLVADLGHICAASACAAEIVLSALPLTPLMCSLDPDLALQLILAGGDDYELCFTAAPVHADALVRLSQQLGLALTRIGRIVPGSGVRVLQADGQPLSHVFKGFDHFG
ncbi:MAG: thiamine-phosphate kinase [Chitinivorax sp.]